MFLIILNAEIKHVKWSTLCLSEVILTRPWLPMDLNEAQLAPVTVVWLKGKIKENLRNVWYLLVGFFFMLLLQK